MGQDRHEVTTDSRLRDCKDRQVSFRWEVALDQRLDDLVRRAAESGERTNRRELLAAVLLSAGPTGLEMGEMLRRYRTASVADALLDAPPEGAGGTVVNFPVHGPGPRAV